jgi:hypothetical protein
MIYTYKIIRTICKIFAMKRKRRNEWFKFDHDIFEIEGNKEPEKVIKKAVIESYPKNYSEIIQSYIDDLIEVMENE